MTNRVRRLSPIAVWLIVGTAVAGVGLAALALVFGGPDVAGCFGVTGC